MTKKIEFTDEYSRTDHNEVAINAFHGGMLPLVALSYKFLREITAVCSITQEELYEVQEQCDKLRDLRSGVRACKEDFESGRISLAEYWHTHKDTGREVAFISSGFNPVIDKIVADYSLQNNQEIMDCIKIIKETQADIAEFSESIAE